MPNGNLVEQVRYYSIIVSSPPLTCRHHSSETQLLRLIKDSQGDHATEIQVCSICGSSEHDIYLVSRH